MSNQDWKNMPEPDFDLLLQDSVPELPPTEVAQMVTPWRTAVNRILTGLTMNVITLNFLGLDYILPMVGWILAFLGFRTLRKENLWFRCCYVLTAIHMVFLMQSLILNATIYHTTVRSMPEYQQVGNIILGLKLVLLLCFWRGFLAIQRKVDLEIRAGGAAVLLIWYVILYFLALNSYDGWMISLIMVAGYVIIIKDMVQLSKDLEEAGYGIKTAPVKVTDGVMAATIIGIVLGGIACGYLFFSHYPMNWEIVESLENESAELKAIREHLLQLGFPENVLNDLTEEDIMACEDALRVVVEDELYPLDGLGWHAEDPDYTLYDMKKDLEITSIAVELPSDSEQWKTIHHFCWENNPGFEGTECVQLWPEDLDEKWSLVSDYTGRLLYDRDGKTYASSYYSIESETRTSIDLLSFGSTKTDVLAVFSMPEKGETHRGYISYSAESQHAPGEDVIVYSWINYVHQKERSPYPIVTAKECRPFGPVSRGDYFVALQRYMTLWTGDESLK